MLYIQNLFLWLFANKLIKDERINRLWDSVDFNDDLETGEDYSQSELHSNMTVFSSGNQPATRRSYREKQDILETKWSDMLGPLTDAYFICQAAGKPTFAESEPFNAPQCECSSGKEEEILCVFYAGNYSLFDDLHVHLIIISRVLIYGCTRN